MTDRGRFAGGLPSVGTEPPIPPDDPALDRLLGDEPRNDMGNCERLIARFGRELMHVPESGWYVAEPGHWSRELGDQGARLRAQRTAQLIAAEADADRSDADRWDRDRLEAHLKFAVSSGNVSRLEGMLRVAESRLMCRREDLDRDPWLLAVANGTLELRSAAPSADGGVILREHRRDDRITRQAPVRYDPEAECPRFRAWVAEILPDPEVALFVQRWIGYCLTGDTGEQQAVLFYGGGANGKSTLINVLRGLLGEYCGTLPVEALLEDERGKSGGQASPEMARLPAVRLVFAAEPEKRRRLSTSALKAMTGGEPMLVRDNYRGFFELHPVFKIFLSFNARPVVPADDEGMWRRLLLVPFLVQIPKERRIARYEDRLLEEAPGILNWALDGYRMWRETGLAPPDAVKAATEDYRRDSDPIGEFLADATEAMPSGSVTAAKLYRAYQTWCERNAQDAWSGTRFGKALVERGLRRLKSSITVYTGIWLRPEYQPPSDDDLR